MIEEVVDVENSSLRRERDFGEVVWAVDLCP